MTHEQTDLLKYPFSACPHLRMDKTYVGLIENRPVAEVFLPASRTAWVVSSYDLVRTVLVKDDLYSRALANGIPGYPDVAGFVLGYDGDDHRRVRRPAAPAFAKPRVELLRPAIARRLDQHLRHLGQALADGAIADLHAMVSLPLALDTIGEVLGVPESERFQFSAWGDAYLGDNPQEAGAAMEAMGIYIYGLIAQRRETPIDDVLSEIVHGEGAGLLTDEELIKLGIGIFVAGFETTAALITMLTYYLLEDRDRWVGLRENPALLPGAVQEALRVFDTGADDGLPRVATRDHELGGILIRQGDIVIPSHIAANHDPAVFPDPHTIDFARTPNPHLGFANGKHVCLGQNLAVVEIETAMSGLLDRFPDLHLAVPATEVRWRAQMSVRGPVTLPVVLG